MKYIRNIFLLILLVTLVFTGCTIKTSNTSESSNTQNNNPIYSYIVDLNELPDGYMFKYQDLEFTKTNKELELEFSNRVEKFWIVSADYEQEYYFVHFRKDVKVPISYLVNELKRAEMPIEIRTPEPQSYSLKIPKGATIEFRGRSYLGNDEDTFFDAVDYNEGFILKKGDFVKQFCFQSFDSNKTIDISELFLYELLEDIEIKKHPLGYEIDIPTYHNNDFSLSWYNYEEKEFTVVSEGKIVAYINENMGLTPVILPDHKTIYLSQNGKKYAYLEDNYLVVRDIYGELVSRTYFANRNAACEGLVWSPNDEHIFCVFLIGGVPKQEKFYLFNTLTCEFSAIGGGPQNYFDKVMWSQDSMNVVYYEFTYGYTENSAGTHWHYDLSDNTLTELGGNYWDTINWDNDEPLLHKKNNGLRFEIYDPDRDEFKSQYEHGCDPQYPEDFMGTILKIFDENDNELASIHLLELLMQNNITIPEKLIQFRPYVAKEFNSKYLYFSISWENISYEERMQGKRSKTNVIGFIDVENFSLHYIEDISHLDYSWSGERFTYYDTYRVDYYVNDLIYYYKGDFVEILDIATKETAVYPLPAEFNYMKLYKNVLLLFDNNSFYAIGPKKTTKVITSDSEIKYEFNNYNQVFIRALTNNDIANSKYYMFDLDKIIELIETSNKEIN